VVTDSFDELVLDPAVDFMLLCYTPRCDVCKALAPRYRMLATLLARHVASVRVGGLNILDNDRDTAWLPEKWTPSIRMFAAPAAGGSGVKGAATLLDYDALLPEGAAAPPTSAAAAAGNRTIVVPTVPELVAFAATAAGRRFDVTPELARDAALAEEEAGIIEQAYEQVLQYMQLWAAYNDAITALPAETLYGAATAEQRAAAASQSIPTTRTGEARAAKELKEAIMAAHKYIVSEAGAGCAERVISLLERIARHVQRRHIAERITATFEEEAAVPPVASVQNNK